MRRVRSDQTRIAMTTPIGRRVVLGGAASVGSAMLLRPGAGRAQAASGTLLRISANGPVGTLDPAKMRVGSLEYNYAFLVFDRLVSFDAAQNVIPGLATSWTPSADQKTWTFALRQGVKWHHGREFDADDVLATFKRLQDPANGSLIRGSLGIVQAIDAPDKYTVRFTLSAPYSALPALTGLFPASILPRDALDTLTTQPIGTGAYRFVSYEPAGTLALVRNPDYFVPGLPKPERVEFHIIPDYSTAVAALERGELEFVWNLPPEAIATLSKSRSSHVSEVLTGNWQTLIMNRTVPPFDNPKVRAAFVRMVDKAAIAEIAMFGHATATNTPIPPGSPFYDTKIPIAPADPAAAKQMLAAAGYPDGLSIGIWTPARQPVRERIAVAFRDQAKAAGVAVEVHEVPEDQYNPAKYQMATGSFNGRPAPDLMLYDWFHSTGSWNHTTWHYNNPEVDKTLDAARQTSDPATQKQLYDHFQELIQADDPGPVLFVAGIAHGVSNKVQNFAASNLSIMDVRGVTLS